MVVRIEPFHSDSSRDQTRENRDCSRLCLTRHQDNKTGYFKREHWTTCGGDGSQNKKNIFSFAETSPTFILVTVFRLKKTFFLSSFPSNFPFNVFFSAFHLYFLKIPFLSTRTHSGRLVDQSADHDRRQFSSDSLSLFFFSFYR